MFYVSDLKQSFSSHWVSNLDVKREITIYWFGITEQGIGAKLIEFQSTRVRFISSDAFSLLPKRFIFIICSSGQNAVKCTMQKAFPMTPNIAIKYIIKNHISYNAKTIKVI